MAPPSAAVTGREHAPRFTVAAGAPAAALIALSIGLAACSSSGSSTPTNSSTSTSTSSAPFVVANTSSVQKLDPQIATNFLDLQALGLVYQPLVTLNASLQVVPDLASSWTFSSDSKSLTLTLRSGVKFDDGSTMTSADVKASLERVLNPKTAAAAASNIAIVASITAPTPQTVVLTLTHPDFSILDGLTTTTCPSCRPRRSPQARSPASQTAPGRSSSSRGRRVRR